MFWGSRTNMFEENTYNLNYFLMIDFYQIYQQRKKTPTFSISKHAGKVQTNATIFCHSNSYMNYITLTSINIDIKFLETLEGLGILLLRFSYCSLIRLQIILKSLFTKKYNEVSSMASRRRNSYPFLFIKLSMNRHTFSYITIKVQFVCLFITE